MVSRGKDILSTESAGYGDKAIQRVKDTLRVLEVEVINEDEIISHSVSNTSTSSAVIPTPGGVTLRSGKKINSDLLIYAAGTKINTSFVPTEWLDKSTGEVNTDPQTMQLIGRTDVFAIGDCAKSNGPKRSYFAAEDAKVVAKNLLQVLQGKAPSYKTSRFNGISITLGKERGVTILPFAILGDWVTTKVKSNDLMVSRIWKMYAPKSKAPNDEERSQFVDSIPRDNFKQLEIERVAVMVN